MTDFETVPAETVAELERLQALRASMRPIGKVRESTSEMEVLREEHGALCLVPHGCKLGFISALKDLLSGWNCIRDTHGDLCGIDWDRVHKARAALAKATGKRTGGDGDE